jgi:hypothetical protein
VHWRCIGVANTCLVAVACKYTLSVAPFCSTSTERAPATAGADTGSSDSGSGGSSSGGLSTGAVAGICIGGELLAHCAVFCCGLQGPCVHAQPVANFQLSVSAFSTRLPLRDLTASLLQSCWPRRWWWGACCMPSARGDAGRPAPVLATSSSTGERQGLQTWRGCTRVS